ncbi:SGNH/GDSL hydrolase family protein [Pseudoroseicyclus tamaricis]|uniref:Phospholipase/lecithinase/hemolysin n=1 Tax=Pseudoroseicyclus tamaricis TaxID=2705421 RepID=A0A6B2K3C7_9RHOB|nr:SGNH/GDSL hydrolase family protein [Pseudoroseicyclus tamaricis]NDV02302.1 hypothetical protein [Pseudoroseicyclus tamaricis]
MSNSVPGPALVIFGDSLSDNGNLFAQAEGLIEEDVRLSLAGAGGQASNGTTWAEQVAAPLGIDDPANYAVAGAEAVGRQTIGGFIDEYGLTDALIVPQDDPALEWDMNLSAQVDRFEADWAGADLSATTALIFIGGNDYAALDPTSRYIAADALALAHNVVKTTLHEAEGLLAAGVERVVLTTMPPARFFPAFNELIGEGGAANGAYADVAAYELLMRAHNEILASRVEKLASEGLDVVIADLTPVAASVWDDPMAFGLYAPLTETLADGAGSSFDADQIGFWDELHPTEALHGIIAAHMAHVLAGGIVHEALGFDVTERHQYQGDLLYYGAQKNDAISAGWGEDVIFGGSGNDQVLAGRGDDIVSLGSGKDLAFGGEGDDFLTAASGENVLNAGAGNDALVSGLGETEALGGNGDDVFVFVDPALLGHPDAPASFSIDGGAGHDILYLVLDPESIAADGAALLAGDAATLAGYGVTAKGVDEIALIAGREGIDSALSGYAWYEEASLWNLV